MNTRRIVAVLVAAAALWLPQAASAQKLQAGKWMVAVTDPGGSLHEIALDVSETAGVTKGMLSGSILPAPIEISDVKIEGRTLTFTWAIENTLIKCTLERTDAGGYDGPCTDNQSPPGRFVMKPPASPASPAAVTSPAAGAASPAARLGAGKWTGTVLHPSMGTMAFDFDVPAAPDAKPTMDLPSLQMKFTIDRLVVDGRKLTFGLTFEGEGGVSCEMQLQDDGSYKGTCSEDGGETSQVSMKPPAKG